MMTVFIRVHTLPALWRQKEARSILGDKCVRTFVPMNMKCEDLNKELCENQEKSTIFLIATINGFCNRLFRNVVAWGLMGAYQLHVLVPLYTLRDLLLQSSSLISDKGRWIPGGTHQPGACCLPCQLLVPGCSQMRPRVCLFNPPTHICVYIYISPPDQVHISEKNVCSRPFRNATVYHGGS